MKTHHEIKGIYSFSVEKVFCSNHSWNWLQFTPTSEIYEWGCTQNIIPTLCYSRWCRFLTWEVMLDAHEHGRFTHVLQQLICIVLSLHAQRTWRICCDQQYAKKLRTKTSDCFHNMDVHQESYISTWMHSVITQYFRRCEYAMEIDQTSSKR